VGIVESLITSYALHSGIVHRDPISRNAKDFIRQCLMLDPANRITMEQAKRHAWVAAHTLTRTNSSASLSRPRARGRSRTVVTAFQLPRQQPNDEPAPRATISAAKSTLDEVNELLGLDDAKKRNLHRSRSTRPGRPTTAAAASSNADARSEVGAGSPPDRPTNARLLTAKNTGDKIDFSLPKSAAPTPAARSHSPVRNNVGRMTMSSTPRTSDSSDSGAPAARPVRKRNSMVDDLSSRSMTLPSNLPNGLEGLESPSTTDDDYSRADAFSDTSSLHGEPWSRPRMMSTVKEEPDAADDRPPRSVSPKPYGAARRASTSTTASTTTATTVTELLNAPEDAQSPKRRDSIKSVGGVTGGTEKALRDQIAALQQEVQGLNALVVKQAQKIARLKAGERAAAGEKVLLPGEVFYRLEELQKGTHDSTIMANFKEVRVHRLWK
jgi:serine/threonine protein kinase